MNSAISLLPGMTLCLGIALAAAWLGRHAPIVGTPVFAILLGIIFGNIRRPPAPFRSGIAFCGKRVLQTAIVLLGAGLGLKQVWVVGRDSLAVLLLSLAAALAAAWIIGRMLKVRPRLIGLVGVGTGICGGSAIAAVAPIIEADDEEIAFAISTVFLFNVAAVLVFPAVGHTLAMTPTGFGLWAGTAINDTSSVVATAFSYGQEAGEYATITKLARTTMIVPVCVGLSFLMRRNKPGAGRVSLWKALPWFIAGFLIAAMLNTFGLFGTTGGASIASAGKFFIVVALAGVGLSATLANLIKTGPRPLLLGLLVWIVVALTSLGVQHLARQL